MGGEISLSLGGVLESVNSSLEGMHAGRMHASGYFSLCVDSGEDCCRHCCYSTPLLSLSLLCLSILGLVGFSLSGIYGLAKMKTVPHVQNG